jgi:hypothetical protein
MRSGCACLLIIVIYFRRNSGSRGSDPSGPIDGNGGQSRTGSLSRPSVLDHATHKPASRRQASCPSCSDERCATLRHSAARFLQSSTLIIVAPHRQLQTQNVHNRIVWGAEVMPVVHSMLILSRCRALLAVQHCRQTQISWLDEGTKWHFSIRVRVSPRLASYQFPLRHCLPRSRQEKDRAVSKIERDTFAGTTTGGVPYSEESCCVRPRSRAGGRIMKFWHTDAVSIQITPTLRKPSIRSCEKPQLRRIASVS